MNGLPKDQLVNRDHPFLDEVVPRRTAQQERAADREALRARLAAEHEHRRGMSPGGRLRGLKGVVDQIDTNRLRGGGDPTIPYEPADPRGLAQQILKPRTAPMTGYSIDPDRSERRDDH